MLLPYIQHGLCGRIWTKAPEPDRVLGPSLLLIVLVIRHQVARGCPSTESETHEECFRTQPACSEKAGMRAQKSFSDVASAETTVSLFPAHNVPRDTVILKRCVVQLTCCDQHPK